MLKNDNFFRILTALFILLVGIVFLFMQKTVQAPEPINGHATPSPLPTTIFFAGDIMLSRNVEDRMAKAQDYTLPFQKVAAVIQNADIAFANLESPFNDTGRHFIPNSLVFNANPKSVEGLKFAGFDVLSTANNHAFDQGLKGIEFTKNLLKQNSILSVGSHVDGEPGSASFPHAVSRNGLNFIFLSFTYASHNDGGISHDSRVDDFSMQENLASWIESEKSHGADIVIVNMHAGTEYTHKPNQAQIDFAHAAIDAGADLVIGEHPHWVQTVEQYQGKWIFYSLGNFVFDQMWSTDTRQGLTLLITYQKEQIKKIELKPVIIEDYCCPRWANSDETVAILKKLDLTNTVLVDNN